MDVSSIYRKKVKNKLTGMNRIFRINGKTNFQINTDNVFGFILPILYILFK